MDKRKRNVSILGSYNASEDEVGLAYELGQALANLDINIVSGGQKKGVMYHLCKGVFDNRKEGSCRPTLVGILPSVDFSQANEFLDIAIPCGGGTLQNSILPLSADVVIAIGGAAGTLAEISFAWQYGKPIGLLGSAGWANKLANKALDARRVDNMPHFSSAKEATEWVLSLI